MNKTQINNINNLEGQTVNRGEGNVFHVKPICSPDLLKKCMASVVELEPGNSAYSYHYHESNEEIFYIISGSGVAETIDGEKSIKAGDVLSFPTGEGGVHVIKNTSKEKLVYLDFSTKSDVEVAHLPKANKMIVVSKNIFTMVDEPTSNN